MLFKKINAWFHLWLGLASGIIVFIISLTGCVLVFEQEIKDLTQPWTKVVAQDESQLMPPSKIREALSVTLPGKEIHSIWYHGLSKSAHIDLESDSVLYVNPYTAEILAIEDHDDIFHFMDEGHRHLWMEGKIGRQVVGWATFIFFFLMISGLILWFPKKWSKTNVDKSFKIKWSARFKRLNYDLHNVLGFYSLLLGLLMAATGLIMSFSWFSKGVYWLAGGKVTERKKPAEIIPYPQNTVHFQVDKAWLKVRKEIAEHNVNDIIVGFPDEPDESIYVCTDMVNGHWRDLFIDPNTLELLPQSRARVSELPFANWLRTVNYGLHVGAIGGLTTKILYFIASLICASLPITGFYVWWHRKKKSKKKKMIPQV